MKVYFAVLLLLIGFSGCKKEENQDEKDREIILQYIEDNNLSAEEGEDGLFYVVNSPGTGDQCGNYSTIKTTYNGYFTNGSSFDSGTIDNFSLINAIRGWQIGMAEFKEGGDGILLIPSRLGYGKTGSSGGSVPGNTVIIFDVELIKVY